MKYSWRVLWVISGGLLAMVAITLLFGKKPVHPGEASPPPIARHHREKPLFQDARTASQLLGEKVEATTGEKLARVNDLVIDERSGRIIFVILAGGGFAGMGVRLKPVPPGALSQATAKDNILALVLDRKRWPKAPFIHRERLADLENPARIRNIYQFYQQTWPPVATSSNGNNALPPVSDHPATTHLKLATELIGQSVVNGKKQEVGEVSDLYVDLAHPGMTRVIFKSSADDSQYFAIPMSAFTVNDSSDNLILNTDPSQFHHAEWAREQLRVGEMSLRTGRAGQIGFNF